MQQLTQKLSNGEMMVQEVPAPILNKGMVLVRTHFSVISAGTESSTVGAARKSLIGKAKERPQQVKQVIDTFKQQGPVQTFRAVNKKLEAYSPLGYSISGEIIDIGEGVTEFKKGDLVACAGVGYANHSEINAVPVNLCVKLDKDTNLRNAAYNTLGAIALQGIRQADLRLGETCAVIGLGLLGQLTGVMLKAAGINVVGIDVQETPVKLAAKHFADLAVVRNTPGVENRILDFSNGIGVDTVIITAATDSLDPVNFAGAITRKKGRVIVVGAVPTGFDRDPYWYKKELELRMSCSYGPGRYDLGYEEKGIDYPPAYVRWTEKRNMQAFQELILNKKIDIDYLTTHEFGFNDSPKAYDMIMKKSEPYLGIVLKYDSEKEISGRKIEFNKPKRKNDIGIGFIGAGSYAQGNLLPNIPKESFVSKIGVLSNTGTTSKRVAERFQFDFCTSDQREIFNNDLINTVFIATRHDTHAQYVIKSLKQGKNVFVEKPLCMNIEELNSIRKVYDGSTQLMVGFNRRYSVLSKYLKTYFPDGPMSMIYRINAGKIPKESWIQDMEIGGGRIIGEVCHFIDYLTWLNGSLPEKIYASSLPDAENNNDTINIQISFENGSTGIVAYYSNGPKSLPKEHIEVFQSGISGIINNFKSCSIYGKKKSTKKLLNQDKGQKLMVEGFLKSIKSGGDHFIPFVQVDAVMKATFAVIQSISNGKPVIIGESQ